MILNNQVQRIVNEEAAKLGIHRIAATAAYRSV